MSCQDNRQGTFVSARAQLAAALVCVGALTACAGGRASEPPSASAATEPEQATAGGADTQVQTPMDPAALKEAHNTIDEAANTSERLADTTAAKADYANQSGSVPGTPANHQTDLERAAEIRRALMGADGLSTSARNTNVLVEQGRVTLRGRVESAAEKARVEEAARLGDGATRIVNELEIAH